MGTIRYVLFVCTVTLFASGLLPAQAGPGSRMPGLEPMLNHEGLYTGLLANGLEVLIIHDTTLPVATVEATVRTGAFTEGPEEDGLNHFFEQLIFRDDLPGTDGNKKPSPYADLGIISHAETGQEASHYTVHVKQERLAGGMAYLSQALRHPDFSPEKMACALRAVAGRQEALEAQPFFHLAKELSEKLWGEQFSRKNVIGPYFRALSFTPELLQEMHKAWFYPQNIIIGVASNLAPRSTYALIDSIFGDWQSSPEQIAGQAYSIPAVEPIDSTHFFSSLNEFADYPVILTGWLGPDTEDDMKGCFAADLLNIMLSQRGSRFWNVMIRNGLAIRADWSWENSLGRTAILLNLVPNPDSLDQAQRVLARELQAMDSLGYFSQAELERGKIALGYRENYAREKSTDRLRKLSNWWAGPGIIHGMYYQVAMEAVSLEDLQEYIQKYLKNQPFVAGILANSDVEGARNFGKAFPRPEVTRAGPATEPEPGRDYSRIFRFRVYFQTRSDLPDGPSMEVIREMASILQDRPELRISINGYTDTDGDAERNYTLSLRRATAIKDLMHDQFNIPEDRMIVAGWGESNPEFDESKPGMKAKNRRVTFGVVPQMPSSLDNPTGSGTAKMEGTGL